MNQTTVLTIAIAAGFAGGFVGSIFMAPATETADAGATGEVALYASEAEVRDLAERVQAVESATNAHELTLGILDGRYDELAARVPDRGPQVPGAAEYGPSGDPLAAAALPTGPGFDAAVAAVIEQREAAERAEREAEREQRREEARQRRLDTIAEQVGLDPGQKDKLAKVMTDMETAREDAFRGMRESGDFDREKARELMADLNAKETALVSEFMSPDQVTKYQEASRSGFGNRVQVGGNFGDGGGRGGRGGGF